MKRLLLWCSSMNLEKKLAILVIVLVIIPILTITNLYYENSESIVRDNVFQSEKQLLHIAAGGIEKLTEQMISVSNTICFDKHLSMKLIKKREGVRLTYGDLTQLYSTLKNAQITLIDYTSYLNIYDSNGECVSLVSTANEFLVDMTQQLDVLSRVEDAEGRFVWIVPHTFMNESTRVTETYITIGRLVDGTNKQGSTAYTMLLFIDAAQLADKLFDMYALPSENEDILIVDGNGRIIVSKNKDMLGTLMDKGRFTEISSGSKPYLLIDENNDDLMINFQEINHTDWTLVKLTDYSAQLDEFIQISRRNLIFLILILIVFVIITYAICRASMSPLKRLKMQIEMVKTGHFDTSASYIGENEIAHLGQSFNQMVQQIDSLIEQKRFEQKSKEQLRLELMQAQINPHFIFNTLNTIKWTAIIHNSPDIASLVQDFGRIISMSIKDVNKLIPLRSEFSNVTSYMNIQRMRYNYPLIMQINCSDEDLFLMVPRLVLQPIVENAVVHGFDSSYERELHIQVNVVCDGDLLQLYITDDGMGIDPKKLDDIKSDLNEQFHKNRFNHIGLQNVHRRIQLTFGEEYGISIKSDMGSGTEVIVRLPVIQGDKQEVESD